MYINNVRRYVHVHVVILYSSYHDLSDPGGESALCTNSFGLLPQLLRDPLQSVAVPFRVGHTAHEHLQRASTVELCTRRVLTSLLLQQPHLTNHVCVPDSAGLVNLVPQDRKRYASQLRDGQQIPKLRGRLIETLPVSCIHKINDCVHIRKVLLPKTTGDLVTTQVKSFECDRTHAQLFHLGMVGRRERLGVAVLQPVQQRRLAGVVQPEEEHLGLNAEQAKTTQDALKQIP